MGINENGVDLIKNYDKMELRYTKIIKKWD
jgi:hypothetical protein